MGQWLLGHPSPPLSEAIPATRLRGAIFERTMSYDFDVRLSNCNHLQLKERMTIDQKDFKTLLYYSPNLYQDAIHIRGTITVKSSVRLFISGTEVPQNHPQCGWDVWPDTSFPAALQLSKLMFRNQVRLTNLVIEIQYITNSTSCLKCNGFSKVNDYTIAKNGSLVHVWDINKLVQRIYKFLLTSSCAFYPSFTSQLKNFIGQKYVGTEDDISNECSNALDNLKRIQLAQKNIQVLTPQEVLKNIEGISSVRDKADPTIVTTNMSVSSYGVASSIPLAFTLQTTNNS